MSKLFTDKDYERANAEAEEALAAVDLSAIKWPKRNRFEGASFSAGDNTPMIEYWSSASRIKFP